MQAWARWEEAGLESMPKRVGEIRERSQDVGVAQRMVSNDDFSELLRGIASNDSAAWNALMQLVYQDLKRVAHTQMVRIAPGQTLSTTVLVHEAFERLAAQAGLVVADRPHFYALCASVMRQIVIDHYRRRSARKRTATPTLSTEPGSGFVSPDIDSAINRLGRSLEFLERRDPKLMRAFEMRYFAGLSDSDIASRLDLSERSVQRLVARARAWVAAGLDRDS
ncbi:MAG: ECF-type sigma factor [Myxococcota bacterium]